MKWIPGYLAREIHVAVLIPNTLLFSSLQPLVRSYVDDSTYVVNNTCPNA